jgi:uncharacterized protein (TIGR02265 family)
MKHVQSSPSADAVDAADVVSSGFVPPRFDARVDLDAVLRRIPAHATGKGMFLNRLLAELSRRRLPLPTQETFSPLQDLPLRFCAELNLHAARALYPGLPLPEALRRVARLSFDTFQDSLAGKLILTGMHHDPHRVLALASRLVGYTTNVGTLESMFVDTRARLICARDTYLFCEWFGVGMAEGVLEACGKQGTVLVKPLTFGDVDFLIRW